MSKSKYKCSACGEEFLSLTTCGEKIFNSPCGCEVKSIPATEKTALIRSLIAAGSVKTRKPITMTDTQRFLRDAVKDPHKARKTRFHTFEVNGLILPY
jgi:DNA-directed RNA polymerase subunit RPC12/RpoP